MLDLLLKQTRRWKIPSGLPSGTKVANKTGETSQYQHDAAIVFGPKTDYVVCIFSNKLLLGSAGDQTAFFPNIPGIKLSLGSAKTLKGAEGVTHFFPSGKEFIQDSSICGGGIVQKHNGTGMYAPQ